MRSRNSGTLEFYCSEISLTLVLGLTFKTSASCAFKMHHTRKQAPSLGASSNQTFLLGSVLSPYAVSFYVHLLISGVLCCCTHINRLPTYCASDLLLLTPCHSTPLSNRRICYCKAHSNSRVSAFVKAQSLLLSQNHELLS